MKIFLQNDFLVKYFCFLFLENAKKRPKNGKRQKRQKAPFITEIVFL
jgi:hypothetical protein